MTGRRARWLAAGAGAAILGSGVALAPVPGRLSGGHLDDAALVAVSGIRWVTAALAAYAVVVCVVAASQVDRTGRPSSTGLLRVVPPSVRRKVAGVAVSAIAAATSIPVAASAAPAGPPPTMVLLEVEATAPPTASSSPADPNAELAAPPTPPPGSEPSGRAWTVAPGDNFWSIAARVASDRHARPATDGEIHPVWIEIIEANRDRLVSPGNPDLLLPGQELVLPST
ncbi:MAG: LysM peptidoglycan-binding domain-containing protein [Acidimicrobiales bacterium]